MSLCDINCESLPWKICGQDDKQINIEKSANVTFTTQYYYLSRLFMPDVKKCFCRKYETRINYAVFVGQKQ